MSEPSETRIFGILMKGKCRVALLDLFYVLDDTFKLNHK